MARWFQSAGLQHLASPNLLMQGYGSQSIEEKQKVFKLPRNLNFNGESGSEPYTSISQSYGASSAADGFYSPDLRGGFGAGLVVLHAMDDTELLSEHVMSEPFEPSPFMLTKDFDDDLDAIPGQQGPVDGNFRAPNKEKESTAKENNVAKIKVVHVMSEPFEPSPFMLTKDFDDDLDAIPGQQGPVDGNFRALNKEKESTAKENNVAKIKVVVRKRPLNKMEMSRKEEDIVTVHDSKYLSVHEPS